MDVRRGTLVLVVMDVKIGPSRQPFLWPAFGSVSSGQHGEMGEVGEWPFSQTCPWLVASLVSSRAEEEVERGQKSAYVRKE